MQKDFFIPEQNIPKLQKNIDKFISKTKATGLPTPSYKIGITINQFDGSSSKIVKFKKVILFWETISSNNWKIVGKLVHLFDGNLINTYDGEIPAKMRAAESYCDACQTKRARNSTYIVQNLKNGSFLQLGEDCLENYFNHSAKNIGKALDNFSHLVDNIKLYEKITFENAPSIWPLELYLACVDDNINKFGWVPKSKAENLIPTSQLAYQQMICESNPQPSEQNFENARQAMEWAQGLSSESNDYEYNIQMIANSGIVEPRSLGYAASIISAYQKHINKKTEENSNFVGNVGDKIEVNLFVNKVIEIETNYGIQAINIMTDQVGNVFVWKSGTALEEGKKYDLRGKIKEHREYNQVKQNHIFYCKTKKLE